MQEYRFFVDVEHPAVVLAKLLDDLFRDIAPADKVLLQAGGYPFRVLHVALAAWQLLDGKRVDQPQVEVGLQHTPHRHPIDAGALHAHLTDTMGHQHITQGIQLWC